MAIDPPLRDFLNRLNGSLKRKASVVIVGGNALVFFGVKSATNDVDIVYRSINPEIGKFCQEYLRKYKARAHAFVDGLFKTMRIKDYLQKATVIDLPALPNLEVRILNIYDILLTKIDRWLPRDQEDIGNALSGIQISESNLDKRFRYLLKYYMGPKDDFIRNYDEFKQALGDRLYP